MSPRALKRRHGAQRGHPFIGLAGRALGHVELQPSARDGPALLFMAGIDLALAALDFFNRIWQWRRPLLRAQAAEQEWLGALLAPIAAESAPHFVDLRLGPGSSDDAVYGQPGDVAAPADGADGLE